VRVNTSFQTIKTWSGKKNKKTKIGKNQNGYRNRDQKIDFWKPLPETKNTDVSPKPKNKWTKTETENKTYFSPGSHFYLGIWILFYIVFIIVSVTNFCFMKVPLCFSLLFDVSN